MFSSKHSTFHRNYVLKSINNEKFDYARTKLNQSYYLQNNNWDRQSWSKKGPSLSSDRANYELQQKIKDGISYDSIKEILYKPLIKREL